MSAAGVRTDFRPAPGRMFEPAALAAGRAGSLSVFLVAYVLTHTDAQGNMNSMNRYLESLSDPVLARLVAVEWSAGNALDAFNDGAIGVVRDVRAESYRLERAYASARRARYAYQNGGAK
jgi:hypothetical protein